eukprot:UN08213
MKIISIPILMILIASVMSEMQQNQKGKQNPSIGDEKKVEGVPVISFCNTTLTPLIVNSYSIKPDDIHANENVTLTIFAKLNEIVTSGHIQISAKIGPIPVYDDQLDLCKEVKAGGMSCPLKATNYNISQTLHIPATKIHATIKASVTITDQTNTQLLCMDIKVHV